MGLNGLTRRSRRHEEDRDADCRKGPASGEDAKEIEGDNSRKVVTHLPSQEVLLTHQKGLRRRLVGCQYVSPVSPRALTAVHLGNRWAKY